MKNKVLLTMLLGCSLMANAKVRLQPMFSDNMVLQQQTSAPLWGEASPNKTVTLVTSWDGKKYKTKSDAKGQWKISVTTPKAGGPYEITISDGTKMTLHDVLIGEVWLCTGQSNMEMPMQGWDVKMNADEIAQSGRFKNIRLLQVNEVTSPKPEASIAIKSNGWMQCNPETVKDFSATGFFFGKNINLSENVPVGLIMTCWGGTVVEAWTSGKTLEEMPVFKDKIAKLDSLPATQEARQKQYDEALKKWREKMAKRVGSYDSKGNCVFAQKEYNDASWQEMKLPTMIEDAGLPGYDGFIWFRKTIDIPSDWVGKDLDLYLSMIDDEDVTYFNGVQIGQTSGFNVQRHYIVPASLVKAGKAVITVRDYDSGGGGGLYGDAKDMRIGIKGSGNTVSLAGIWKANPSTDLRKVEPAPVNYAGNPNIPSVLFNSMINPLVPYSIRGAIWYQGENNVDRAYQYRELLPMMIRDWRSHWGYNFPFYIMQLANYMERHEQPIETAWAELREAQLLTAKHVDNTAMAVNIDIGNPKNIHPTTKNEVGRRLALLAEGLTYGKNIEYSGPEYESYKIDGNTIRLSFSHVGKGLRSKDGGKLTGFAIAGPDHKFHWADAKIDGNTIVVSSSEVDCPLAVRYAWDDNPECNLTNESGLPASPFRTDEWKGQTFGRE